MNGPVSLEGAALRLSVFPDTQLYLPLAFFLALSSLGANVLLSEDAPALMTGTWRALLVPVGLCVAFVHLVALVVVSGWDAWRIDQMSDFWNLFFHLIVLVLAVFGSVPLAGAIAQAALNRFLP